jgi:hypothetical protein
MSSGLIVTIAYPGWRNKRILQAVTCSASWEISRIGRCSFQIPAKDAHKLGFTELPGLWDSVNIGRTGLSGGIINRNPYEL